MKDTYTLANVPVVTDNEENIDYKLFIYGTYDPIEIDNDTLAAALFRYMKNKGVGNNQLANMTGIDKGEISRYLNGKRKISKDYLCAICIALRLMTCQQRYLFYLADESLPDDKGKPNIRSFIIREYMDGCCYNAGYTLARCNARLRTAGEPLLTFLKECKG